MICCEYKQLIEKSKPGENRLRKAMGLPLKSHDCQAADLLCFKRNKQE